MKGHKDAAARALMAAEIDQIVISLLDKGVTIQSIITELGCSDRTLMNYRNGVSTPPADIYWKIKSMSADKAALEQLEKFGFVTRGIQRIRKLISL